MTENLTARAMLSIALTLIIILCGLLIHRTGQPYHHGIFAVHKLATVAFVVLLVRQAMVLLNHQGAGTGTIILILLAALSISGLIISGGAMSLNKGGDVMLSMHRVSAGTFLISVFGIFYSLIQFNQ